MLIGLAKDATDDAARELGKISAERNNAERQLQMLHDYRQDYLTRLSQAMQNGMAASDCHNYQRFIGTLDDAIAQQGNVLRDIDQQLHACRLNWQNEKRKLSSFDTLAQRREQARQVVENRREQRVNDEYSARLVQNRARLH